MKSILLKGTRIVIFAIFSLAACTRLPSKTAIPTATVLSTASPIRLGEYKLLSPEDMRFDLDELFVRIEKYHPEPYARRSKEDVDLDRQRIYEELGQPMTMIDFYKKVAPLVSSLGDYHTQVFPSRETLDEIDAHETFFPLVIELKGEQAFLIGNYTGDSDIPLGAELLAINGTPFSGVRTNLIPSPNLRFEWNLWFLNGSIPEYQLELLPPGAATPVNFKIPGLTVEEMDQYAATTESWEPATYRTLPGETIGVLTLNTFEDTEAALKSAFARIEADEIQHLIIDVRVNIGGEYSEVDEVMNYLTDRPYRICSRSYKAPFDGYGSGKPRETKCADRRPFNASEPFRGELYLLIGPETFSAAITFATVLQDFGLATLLGEETNDTASYCAYIMSGGNQLPRTGLRYIYSRTCYVRPSGVVDERGVIPDIFIETTIQDRVAGTDPVLDYALEMIRKSDPTP